MFYADSYVYIAIMIEYKSVKKDYDIGIRLVFAFNCGLGDVADVDVMACYAFSFLRKCS